ALVVAVVRPVEPRLRAAGAVGLPADPGRATGGAGGAAHLDRPALADALAGDSRRVPQAAGQAAACRVGQCLWPGAGRCRGPAARATAARRDVAGRDARRGRLAGPTRAGGECRGTVWRTIRDRKSLQILANTPARDTLMNFDAQVR